MELGNTAFRRTWIVTTGIVLLSRFAAPSVVSADVYYYQDADGVFHFTEVPGPETQPFLLSNEPGHESAHTAGVAAAEPTPYDHIIHEVSARYEVEPALVKAVIRVESGFDEMAVSPRGARGLMQLMPKTAKLYGAANLHDPRENIRAGVRHLRRLLDRYRENVSHVLAAYNAGDGPVQRYRGIPPYPETRRFITRVLAFFQEYRRQDQLAGSYTSRF